MRQTSNADRLTNLVSSLISPNKFSSRGIPPPVPLRGRRHFDENGAPKRRRRPTCGQRPSVLTSSRRLGRANKAAVDFCQSTSVKRKTSRPYAIRNTEYDLGLTRHFGRSILIGYPRTAVFGTIAQFPGFVKFHPFLQFTLVRLHRVPSTQDWARDWARMGAREGLVVLAREQTAGRGRLARRWVSPPGGLYLSLLLRPDWPLRRAQQLTMLVSLAAMEACRKVAGVEARPKWPNDLLWEDKKLAGVLTELESDGDRLAFAIIGLGLNVNHDFTSDPLAETATSLRMATGRTWDVDEVLEAFLAALAQGYRRLQAGESPHQAWARDLEPLGRRVRVLRQGQPPLRGWAVGVTPQGALRVQDDAGVEHVVWAGDVSIEKPRRDFRRGS